MNNHNILQKGRTKLDGKLDVSELYDYELVDDILGKVDVVLDYSELYDYELVEILLHKIDVTLDYSEFYDFKLGISRMDYSENEILAVAGKYLITDDEVYIVTDDNYFIEYD